MRKVRWTLTIILVLVWLGLMAFDFITRNPFTFDAIVNTIIGYTLGMGLGYLWPWFDAQPRDAKGRYVKA